MVFVFEPHYLSRDVLRKYLDIFDGIKRIDTNTYTDLLQKYKIKQITHYNAVVRLVLDDDNVDTHILAISTMNTLPGEDLYPLLFEVIIEKNSNFSETQRYYACGNGRRNWPYKLKRTFIQQQRQEQEQETPNTKLSIVKKPTKKSITKKLPVKRKQASVTKKSVTKKSRTSVNKKSITKKPTK